MLSTADIVRSKTRRRRIITWAIVGLVAVGAIAGYARHATQASLELDEAETALRRNDPVAARIHLDRALARRPNDARGLLLAARAARRSNSHADAERYLSELEAASESTEASRFEWSLLGVQQGDFGDDEDRLRIAVGRNHPEETAILEALAKGYVAAFRWTDALAALTRLLDRDRDHVPGLILRAAISERFRRVDEAEGDLRRAVTIAPDNALAHAALAGLKNHRGQTREAIYHFERALQSHPTNNAARLGLARALADSADLAGAAEQLDTLLAADPNYGEALVERGRLELRRGLFSEAWPFLERAARVVPWNREAHELCLIAMKELGRPDAVAKSEARLAELDRDDALGGKLKLRARDAPGDAEIRVELWDWSVRNGQTEEGIAWVTEVLRANPRHTGGHAAMAGYFDRAGQPRRAALHRSAAGK